MLQDRLEALLLVSFEKDISLALTNFTNDLHEAVLFLTNSKLFAFCTTYFPQIYIKLPQPEAVFHSEMQPKRWRLGFLRDPAGEAYSRPQSSIYGNLVHANICQTFAKFTLKWLEIQDKTFPATLGRLYRSPGGPGP